MSNLPNQSLQGVTHDLKVQGQYLPDGRIALGIMLEDGVLQFIVVGTPHDMMRLAKTIKQVADNAPKVIRGGNSG
jgi:hypothetical protein